MGFDLRKKVFAMLKAQPDTKFSAREIAEWIVERYPEDASIKLQRSQTLTTEADLLQQITAEVSAQRPRWQVKVPQFKTIEGIRPRLYYWSVIPDDEEVFEVPSSPITDEIAVPQRLSEQDLYPRLVQYLRDEYSVHAVRIDEKTASNRHGLGSNRWLFADVVGMEHLVAGFDNDVREAIRQSNARQLKLWSFEVKRLLNGSNVREAYYQAVSNSSWANVGYLVAADIEGKATQQELELLHAMHGIGILLLNTDEPSESQILIPARERPEVEWAMCNRLATENRDFKNFMRAVRQFYQTGDMPASARG